VNEWDAEHVASEARARALLRAARPDLAGEPLVKLGEGFDNTCYLVGDLVLRFPRRTVALELLETERRVLAHVAPRVPLAVPAPVIEGEPGEGFPWPWLGVRHVPGETACRADPSDEERLAAADALAAFLKALWPLDAGAPPDTWSRADVKKRAPRALENLAKLGAEDLAPVLDVEPWEPRVVTCHGDLYARHLVFDDGELTGVIDWGDCHAGDRVKDLAVAFLFFPAEARARFRAALGDVDDREWAAARAIALFHATVEVLYGRDRGDDAMIEIGARALEWIREDAGA
jgi:aminoglycoside phosphotransferase (APT) family kinase protein